MGARVVLHCEKCHCVVGETFLNGGGEERVRISLKVRGQSRRVMIVRSLESVQCDRCGHQGVPLPVCAAAPVPVTARRV